MLWAEPLPVSTKGTPCVTSLHTRHIHTATNPTPTTHHVQEKSYFALHLPAGWWVFGLDLALVGDIDMCQYRCARLPGVYVWNGVL